MTIILLTSPREVSNGLHKTEGAETKSSVNATHMVSIVVVVLVLIIIIIMACGHPHGHIGNGGWILLGRQMNDN